MRVRFHPEALAELESAVVWYSERSARTAREWLVAVDVSLESIASDPARFALFVGFHRSCRVPGFPYSIVFRHDADLVLVIALAHASRRPGYWRNRSPEDPFPGE